MFEILNFLQLWKHFSVKYKIFSSTVKIKTWEKNMTTNTQYKVQEIIYYPQVALWFTTVVEHKTGINNRHIKHINKYILTFKRLINK